MRGISSSECIHIAAIHDAAQQVACTLPLVGHKMEYTWNKWTDIWEYMDISLDILHRL